eukprot:TRINITY_DN14278_c0_g1_i1.p1 TRINITY_DN14278_c0_g1~~TRINITY_DN14278_c0_g1_i1.p1  ORF type:complete len:310 (-),score=40.33 TRINITY_DN14278_c0_g1_i1:281-1210(-)
MFAIDSVESGTKRLSDLAHIIPTDLQREIALVVEARGTQQRDVDPDALIVPLPKKESEDDGLLAHAVQKKDDGEDRFERKRGVNEGEMCQAPSNDGDEIDNFLEDKMDSDLRKELRGVSEGAEYEEKRGEFSSGLEHFHQSSIPRVAHGDTSLSNLGWMRELAAVAAGTPMRGPAMTPRSEHDESENSMEVGEVKEEEVLSARGVIEEEGHESEARGSLFGDFMVHHGNLHDEEAPIESVFLRQFGGHLHRDEPVFSDMVGSDEGSQLTGRYDTQSQVSESDVNKTQSQPRTRGSQQYSHHQAHTTFSV